MAAIIICVVLLVAAAGLTFRSTTYATVVAFLGLCVAGLVPGISIGLPTYAFWGVAMLIVVSLNFILPKAIVSSGRGVPYIYTAALSGMLVGLAISHAAMIAGTFIAAAIGGVAYARTPQGRVLDFPTHRFWNYLCAKGLPAVIAFSIIGTALAVIMSVELA